MAILRTGGESSYCGDIPAIQQLPKSICDRHSPIDLGLEATNTEFHDEARHFTEELHTGTSGLALPIDWGKKELTR